MRNNKRNKIIRGIKRNLIRKYTFYYLIKYSGKGMRDSIKRIYIEDNQQKVIATHAD